MGSLIVIKVDTTDIRNMSVSGVGPVPEGYLEERGKSIEKTLKMILDEDFDVVAIDSRDSLEILSDAKLRELGLKRTKEIKRKPLDSNGSEIPSNVQLLLEGRQRAMNNGDYNKCMELRDEIRIKGYEVEDTSTGPKLVKK